MLKESKKHLAVLVVRLVVRVRFVREYLDIWGKHSVQGKQYSGSTEIHSEFASHVCGTCCHDIIWVILPGMQASKHLH